jgi:50S ribosomal protein L16 3-hydroxylase
MSRSRDSRPSEVLTRLGTVPVARFMRTTWQRRPLLLRQALPGFTPPLDADALLALCRRDDVEARLVERRGDRWSLRYAPLPRLPARRRSGWTVLLQGADTLHEGAHALLRRFRFVPDARLDDLMASFATDGGGVGPHVDAYDVFLLQAQGRRRWRIGRQRDLRWVEGAPLRILADFRPQQELVLEPGDMLYLPPGIAHEGTAIGECVTYSIGFRAPSFQELLEPFLSDVALHAALRGHYVDPGLRPTPHPGALPPAMITRLHRALTRHRPGRADMARFLLVHLSEPKAQIVFERPQRPLQRVAFARAARRQGVALDRRTRLLYHRAAFAINGEHRADAALWREPLRQLADRRALDAAALRAAGSDTLLDCLHAWYRAGWLKLAEAPRR